MRLTDRNGNSVALGSRLGAGGEAEIFNTTGPSDLVAKIYHQTSAERVAKLQVMISAPPADPTVVQGHRSICWPTSLLFDHQRIAIGFLMPRVNSAGNLPIFKLYNPQDRQDVAPGFTWQYLMRAAVNVASVISAIHSRGYVVGDLNESNILVSDSALVSLVDCDSMQVPQPDTGMLFRCPVGKPEFTPPELQGCDFARVDRLQEHDNFGLGVLIFQLLMEGTHPFSGVWRGSGDPPPIEERIRHGSSPYAGSKSTIPMPGAPPFDILPVGLQTMFQRCFRDGFQTPGARPAPREWQAAMATAELNVRTCTKNRLHVYSAHLILCPWCDRTNLLGGFDPFPAGPVQRPLRGLRSATPASNPQNAAPTRVSGGAAVPARVILPIPPPLRTPGSPSITIQTQPSARVFPPIAGLVLIIVAVASFLAWKYGAGNTTPPITESRGSVAGPAHTDNDILDNDADVWWVRNNPVVRDYGEHTFDVFRRHPAFLTRVQQIRPGFDAHNVDVSHPSVLAKLRDGREIFLMGGCRPHDCPGYTGTIAIDAHAQEMFLLETEDGSKNAYFGRADRVYKPGT
jgi:hypothetical protein